MTCFQRRDCGNVNERFEKDKRVVGIILLSSTNCYLFGFNVKPPFLRLFYFAILYINTDLRTRIYQQSKRGNQKETEAYETDKVSLRLNVL